MHYKFLTLDGRAPYADVDLPIGEWLPKIENLKLCKSGYHVLTVEQLSTWFQMGKLYEVSVQGDSINAKDKSAWQEMRIGRHVGTVTKKIAVQLAIESAESVLHLFEDRFPNDIRPRQAIEAARNPFAYAAAANATAYAAAANAAANAAAYADANAAAANAAAYAAAAYAAANSADAAANAAAANAADAAAAANSAAATNIAAVYMATYAHAAAAAAAATAATNAADFKTWWGARLIELLEGENA